MRHPTRDPRHRRTKGPMRIVLAMILCMLWWLGISGSYALGVSVDLLLAIALLVLVSELRRHDG